MKSYKAQTSALVLLVVIAAPPFARADKKDDLYNRGTAAVNSGDAVAARDAFCQLAGDAPDYKDAATQCSTYKGEAQRQLNRYNQNYFDGVQAIQDGKYDLAETKLRNVKAGDRAEDAKKKLAEVIRLKQDKAAADAAAKNSADQDSQMKGKLDQGIDAYNRADFGSANRALSGVTGKYQGEAQNYLTKIRNYEAKMAEAAQAAAAKNYSAAASAYTEAARINPTGPGEPLAQVTKMTQLATSAAVVPPVANNTPPVTKAAVSKDVVKTIDVARFVADGQKALAKGDFKKARRYFQDVLSQDSRNQDAVAGMAELKSKDTAQAAATDEDPLLAKLIRGYYEGNYNDVESLLNTYIYSGQGKKVGLASFYAGASMLTRYYLGGAIDDNLKREAKKKFAAAGKVEGFKVPEKFISPKILKEYADATKTGT